MTVDRGRATADQPFPHQKECRTSLRVFETRFKCGRGIVKVLSGAERTMRQHDVDNSVQVGDSSFFMSPRTTSTLIDSATDKVKEFSGVRSGVPQVKIKKEGTSRDKSGDSVVISEIRSPALLLGCDAT
jgi:hypothetical protein